MLDIKNRNVVRFSVSLILIALFFSSCSTSKSSATKCNGKRGVRTPMGVM